MPLFRRRPKKMFALQTKTVVPVVTALLLAAPAYGQSLPSSVVGVWDVSLATCAEEGTSVTQINIAPQRVDTFGGNAIIREVEQTGDVTFAAADFQQLEGAANVEPRERAYFRFDQSSEPDRMRFVWKNVQTVDLVRCETDATEGASAPSRSESPATTHPVFDGQLPIPLGLWVVAGTPCQSPANAFWRVYDGAGLRGASSTKCEIDAAERQGDSIVFSQLCTASYNGEVAPTRDRITITAPRRFTIVEDSEETGRDFNWCGPQLHP